VNELLITRAIRPVVVFGALGAFLANTLGLPHLLRGSNLSELELQIVWSVFSLYVVLRGGEKITKEFKKSA
jgi:hypothetical protein